MDESPSQTWNKYRLSGGNKVKEIMRRENSIILHWSRNMGKTEDNSQGQFLCHSSGSRSSSPLASYSQYAHSAFPKQMRFQHSLKKREWQSATNLGFRICATIYMEAVLSQTLSIRVWITAWKPTQRHKQYQRSVPWDNGRAGSRTASQMMWSSMYSGVIPLNHPLHSAPPELE